MAESLKRVEKLNKKIWGNLSKLFVVNKQSEGKLNAENIRNILIVRTDRIGDMAVTTALIHRLRELAPQAKIAVFGSEFNQPLIEDQPWIGEVFVKKRNLTGLIAEVLRCRKLRYQLVLNVNLNSSLSNSLLSHFCSPGGIKVGSDANREYEYCYNKLLPFNRDNSRSMAVMLLDFLDIFKQAEVVEDVRLRLDVGKESLSRADEMLESIGVKEHEFIILNISSGNQNRKPSMELIEHLCDTLPDDTKSELVLLAVGNDRSAAQELESKYKNKRVSVAPEMDLKTVTALIKRSSMLVGPDTGLVHIACCVGTSVSVLYTRSELFYNEWQPVGVKSLSLFPEGDLPVSKIEPQYAGKKIIDFFHELRDERQSIPQ